MSNELRNLKSGESKLLFKVVEKLSESMNQDELRRCIAEDLLALLRSDYFASFIWSPERKVFEHAVHLNMSQKNLEQYDKYYQYRDPITPSLQKRRCATLVCEIMPQKELEKTEFFNDFLMKDGLHHGVNVYAYDGDVNIGDIRIWRSKNRPFFGKHEAALLDIILPYYRNALRNARIVDTVRGISNFWCGLLENTPIALFLFDDAGHLLYRNERARRLEKELSNTTYSSFYNHISSQSGRGLLETEWGPFCVSVLRSIFPYNSRPTTAVMVYSMFDKRKYKSLLKSSYELSPREQEICIFIYKGLTDKEIASALGISFYTVRTHIEHIFIKLDVTTRTEIIYRLLENN